MTAPSAARPIFVVSVKDLDDGPKTLSGEISIDWLRNALEGSEATPADRGGSLEVHLSKNGGREVLVRGVVRVSVIVPCARTLAPIALDLSPEILLLLRRTEAAPERQRGAAAPDAKPRAKRAKRERGDSTGAAPEGAGARHGRPGGNHGTRAQPRGGWDDDPELGPIDAAQDTFEGEQIVLDPFIREFILLELPLFPVRQDLPSLPVEARASAPDFQESETSIDPRLAPLAELKDRLAQKQKQNKE
jgi:uncharacterized protein